MPRGYTNSLSSPTPISSAMSSDADPSTLTLEDLSKRNKKEILKYFSALQGLYTERGKKYGVWSL